MCINSQHLLPKSGVCSSLMFNSYYKLSHRSQTDKIMRVQELLVAYMQAQFLPRNMHKRGFDNTSFAFM
jgi:hypothetical protein